MREESGPATAGVEDGAAVIELIGVSRWYGQVIGLNDVTVRVRSGVTGLLGPNGAGKSTLIRLATGQISPSLGAVRVLGELAFQNRNILARLGCCPDIEKFDDERTGRAFLEGAALLCGHGRKQAAARALDLLDLVGLKDAGGRPIGSYSKGMRQRLKLAQALVNDPDVLVLDEPLTGMDPLGRRHVVDLITRWGAEGRCVLVSSHILHEIEAMTDNVILIHHGRVLAEGVVHEIRRLLRGCPHRVTIGVDDPRGLAARLLPAAGVVAFRFGADELTVETTDPSSLFVAVEGVVLDGGLEVRRLFTQDDSLEAVFDYLVA
ncbi:MAG: ABC transporter ATP-binding protein [Planctomycetes bacterium]|nr:ABC transporter ATP-binding protein [Planctomycetota bacterium]